MRVGGGSSVVGQANLVGTDADPRGAGSPFSGKVNRTGAPRVGVPPCSGSLRDEGPTVVRFAADLPVVGLGAAAGRALVRAVYALVGDDPEDGDGALGGGVPDEGGAGVRGAISS